MSRVLKTAGNEAYLTTYGKGIPIVGDYLG
jgi:hypothetical protein